MYAFEKLRSETANILSAAGLKDVVVEIPPENIDADLAIPCFTYAKSLKKSPVEIAKNVAESVKIPKNSIVGKITAMGPYVNVYASDKYFCDSVDEIITDADKYAHKKPVKKTMVVDMSAPNIAKPMSVGHLRSTIIGDSIARIYSSLGWNVIRDNHLGDKKKVEKNPIPELLSLYVKFHEKSDKDSELDEKAREEFKKLENGDKENTKLWKWFIDVSLIEFKKTYSELDVDFDLWLGESFYNDMNRAIVDEALKKGIAKKDDGAIIIKYEDYKNIPPFLIQKKDGATLYSTRDLSTIKYRVGEFKPDKIVYAVGGEQAQHFIQLFNAAEMLGYAKKEALIHVGFGLISLPEGKMSTRKGRVIYLQDLLNKSYKHAEKIINEKNPELKNKKKVAKKIGVGAVKFNDLSQNRVKNIMFNWDKMLSFEGDTGPYLQYTHARACSILRKIGITKSPKFVVTQMAEEKDLILHLSKYLNSVELAASLYEPHHIATYLLALAHKFNLFYQKCPVMSETDEKIKNSRIALVFASKQVIANGLYLLGIDAVEEM
ncbi:arginine--tRNA ligase [archaeon]|nr:arginine--tRNA ligase [archaeon]